MTAHSARMNGHLVSPRQAAAAAFLACGMVLGLVAFQLPGAETHGKAMVLDHRAAR